MSAVRGGGADARVDASLVAHAVERYTGIASVNPTLGGGAGESALGEALAEDLAELGLRVEFQPVEPGRANVLGHLHVDDDLPTITLDAHLDTVPPAGDATSEPRWEGDTLFARGACDDKASLAAMVEAVRAVVTRGSAPACNVTVLGSVDEETRCLGAEAAHEIVGGSDLIVVGEPTNLDVATWHKGTTRFEIETHGRTCHSAVPHLGTNAIELMNTILTRLVNEVIPTLTAAQEEGRGGMTANIGAIAGGGPLNQVPDRCRVGLDVRRLPGQVSSDVLAHVDAAIEDLVREGQAVRLPPFVDSPAFESTCTDAMLRGILALARQVHPAARHVGLPYGTNASRLARSGAPTLVLGPGDIENAHAPHEHVGLAETVQAAELFVALIDNLPELVTAR